MTVDQGHHTPTMPAPTGRGRSHQDLTTASEAGRAWPGSAPSCSGSGSPRARRIASTKGLEGHHRKSMMQVCAWLIAPVAVQPWWDFGGGRGGAAVGCRCTICPMHSDLMTPPEVAEYLGLSRNAVYGMLARGEVPGQLRLGRRWRISRPAFLRELHDRPIKSSPVDLSSLGS